MSHGICEECRERLHREEGIPALDFLASMKTPGLVVDGERRVGAVNREALLLAGQNVDEVIGKRFGLAFACVNATRAGDCGVSPLCGACVVRQTVEHTLRTGEARSRVPATLSRDAGARPEDTPLRVSTRRTGRGVLIQIEAAG